MLAFLVLLDDDETRRKVRDPDRRVGGVDRLTSRPAGAVDVDPQVFVVDLYVDLLGFGRTATVAAEVWIRPPLSVAGTR